METVRTNAVTDALASFDGPASMRDLVARIQASVNATPSEITGKVLSLIPQTVVFTPDRDLVLRHD